MDWTGQTLDGRYRIERVLGQGGMGTAYLAYDERVKRRVVVKAPHPALLLREGFRERFEREIRSLLDLEHPRIVKVLDVGTRDDVPYAVLQYLGGGSLRDRMDRGGGALASAEVLGWLPHVADALDFLHARAWLHRDVKPANILFDEAGHVFLSDFGIAKAASAITTGITETGLTPGSPSYMAPECALGETLGPAYDQYALGVAVYEALAGKVPFDVTDALAALVVKIQKDPRPLGEAAPSVAMGAAAAVMRALAKAPADRFPTCAAFASAFQEGLARAVVAAQPTLVPDRAGSIPTLGAGSPPTTSRRRRLRFAVFAAVAAAVVGIGWVVGFGRGDESSSGRTDGAATGAGAPRREDLAVAPSPAMGPPAPPAPPAEVAATVSIDLPAAEAWVTGPTLRVAGSATGSGRVLVAGVEALRNRTRFEASVPLPAEGEFIVEAHVERDGKRVASDRRIVRVDRTPPDVLVVAPSDFAVLEIGPIKVQGRVTDASKVAVVVDGKPVPVAPDGSFTFDVITPEDTPRDVRIVATDQVNQWTEKTVRGVRWKRAAAALATEAIAAEDLPGALRHGRTWIEVDPSSRGKAEDHLVAALGTTKASSDARRAYALGLVELFPKRTEPRLFLLDDALSTGDLAGALAAARRWLEAEPSAAVTAEDRLVAALDGRGGSADARRAYALGLVTLFPQRTEPRRALVADALARGDLPAARAHVDAWVKDAGTTWGPAAEASAQALALAVEKGTTWRDVATARASGEALLALLGHLGPAGTPAANALAARVEGVAAGKLPLDAPILAFLTGADPKAHDAIRDRRVEASRATQGKAGPEVEALLAYGRASGEWTSLRGAFELVARAAAGSGDAATLSSLLAEPGARPLIADVVATSVQVALETGSNFPTWARLAVDLARGGLVLPDLDAAVAKGAAAAAKAAPTATGVDEVVTAASSVAKLPRSVEAGLRGEALARTADDAKDLGDRVAAYGALAGREVPPELWTKMFHGRVARKELGDAVFWLGRLESRGALAPAVAERAKDLRSWERLLTQLRRAKESQALGSLNWVDSGETVNRVQGRSVHRLLRITAIDGDSVTVEAIDVDTREVRGTAILKVSPGRLRIESSSVARSDFFLASGFEFTPGVPTDPLSSRWFIGQPADAYDVYGGRVGNVGAVLLVPAKEIAEIVTNPRDVARSGTGRVAALRTPDERLLANAFISRGDHTISILGDATRPRRLRGYVALDYDTAASYRKTDRSVRVQVSFEGGPAAGSVTVRPSSWLAPLDIPVPAGARTFRIVAERSVSIVLGNLRVEGGP